MNFDSAQSLQNITVLVTRSREQNEVLREHLEARGAEVIPLAALRFAAVSPTRELRRCLSAPADYTHLVFTSQIAVRFFVKVCEKAGVSPSRWRHADMAAVGPATAAALREHGWTASLTPRGGTGEALARELLEKGHLDADSRVLIPQSAIARPELEQILAAAGVRVTPLSVYATTREDPRGADQFLSRMEKDAPPEAVLFASPSAVDAFLDLTGDVGEQFLQRPETVIVSIGPTTSRALETRGYRMRGQAETPGVEGLVTALEAAVRP